mmetsp:Transcript_19060/g.31227  ORF Transcript_19060/g.31227 Transcript_19060/m.31227 type:complete len:523 (+) Transcript_19060:368-1936(+)
MPSYRKTKKKEEGPPPVPPPAAADEDDPYGFHLPLTIPLKTDPIEPPPPPSPPTEVLPSSPYFTSSSLWGMYLGIPPSGSSPPPVPTPIGTLTPDRWEFADRVYQTIIDTFTTNLTFKVAYLTFHTLKPEATDDGPRKVAKALLKQNRTQLLLYHAYASVELLACGKGIAEARRVYQTALSASKALSNDPEQKRQVPLLHRALVELEFGEYFAARMTLKEDKKDALLQALIGASSAEGSSDATKLMKARQRLRQRADDVITVWSHDRSAGADVVVSYWEKENDNEIHWVVLHAYLEYLQSGLSAARAIFDRAVNALSSSSPSLRGPIGYELEGLFAVYARLIYLHSRCESTPLQILRTVLTKALESFPSNPLFLSLFVEWESKARIANRTRLFFDQICRGPSATPIVWEMSIRSEVGRTGVTHRIRALFEKALNSDSKSSGCVGLWRLYMRFELGCKNPSAAVRIYYRALKACPWARNVWMECFRLLRSHMLNIDLAGIVDLMQEKELRVRTTLEEAEILQG